MIKQIIAIVFLANVASAIDFNKQNLSGGEISEISSAIYRIEGGSKTIYPYGVRSINTGGDKSKAKQICEKTIVNNFRRWQNSNKSIDFLTFLANRYCPPSADKKGNSNWIKNIHSLVK